jgi:hypothetical protein
VEVFIELSRMKFLSWGSPIDYDVVDEDPDDFEVVVEKIETTTAKTETTSSSNIEEWEEETWIKHQKEKKTEFEAYYIPCDKKSELYVLQQNYTFSDRSYLDSGLR